MSKEFRYVCPAVSGLGKASFRPRVVLGTLEERRRSELKMYEVKQSDDGIVPVKAANKGVQVSAELSEGRTSTKKRGCWSLG